VLGHVHEVNKHAMEPHVPLSALSLASNVRVQLEASKDTVHRSQRVLQNSEAILGADTPLDDREDEENEEDEVANTRLRI
jgi:hypothetical protein